VIGMPSATLAGSGAGLPAAAAVPPSGLAAADLAFDDVFRQLTGGLLATAAVAGEAPAAADVDLIPEGEGREADAAIDALPFAVVPLPVIFTLPALTPPPPALADGKGGDMPAEAAADRGGMPAASTPPAALTAAFTAAFDALTPETAPFANAEATAEGHGLVVAAEDAEVLAGLTPPATAADVAPEPVVQAAQTAAAASGGGAESGAGDAPYGRKQGRAWTGAMRPGLTPPVTAAPVSPAAAIVTPSASGSEPVGPVPAAGAAWRAALASSAPPEPVGAAAGAARAPATPGLVTGVPPAVELAAIRDRGPTGVETPLAMTELDAATGESVHAQIVKSIRLQWTSGLGEARVILKPGYLGEVTASVKVEQGVVTATLLADTPDVRRWMESHTATLRDALVEHGLKLDRLTVGEPERQTAQGDRQPKPRQQPEPQAPRQRARRERSDTDTPFEVTTD
jgi:hypothetical protein